MLKFSTLAKPNRFRLGPSGPAGRGDGALLQRDRVPPPRSPGLHDHGELRLRRSPRPPLSLPHPRHGERLRRGVRRGLERLSFPLLSPPNPPRAASAALPPLPRLLTEKQAKTRR